MSASPWHGVLAVADAPSVDFGWPPALPPGPPRTDSPSCGPLPFDECGPMPPQPRQTADDVVPARAGTAFTFSDRGDGGPWSECERDLVEHAWGLLQDSLPTIRWAICMATRMAAQYGPDEYGPSDPSPESPECLPDVVMGVLRDERPPGSPPPIALFKHEIDSRTYGPDEIPCEYKMIAYGLGIGFCIVDTQFDRAVRMWCFGSPAERACALILFAASILHELTHKCGYKHVREDDDTIGPCSVPYLTGSIMLTALGARFPAADDTRCCAALPLRALGTDAPVPSLPEACPAPDSPWVPPTGVRPVHPIPPPALGWPDRGTGPSIILDGAPIQPGYF